MKNLTSDFLVRDGSSTFLSLFKNIVDVSFKSITAAVSRSKRGGQKISSQRLNFDRPFSYAISYATTLGERVFPATLVAGIIKKPLK